MERAGIYKSLPLLRLKQNYVEFAYFPSSLATTVHLQPTHLISGLGSVFDECCLIALSKNDFLYNIKKVK